MALNGIPISDEQCIGQSLPIINEAFQTLDANTAALSSAVDTVNVALGTKIDKPTSPTNGQFLTYSQSVSSWIATTAAHANHTGAIISNGLSTSYNEVVPASKGGAGTNNGILKANGVGTVTAAIAGTDYVIPSTLSFYATVASLANYAPLATLSNYATVVSLNNKIDKPASPVNGYVLTYNGSTWVASPPTGGGGGITNLTGDIVSSGNATVYNNVVPSTKGGAGSVNGLLKANGGGIVTAAIAGVDYVIPSTLSSYLTSSNFNLTGDVISVGTTTQYGTVVPSSLGGAGTVNGILKADGSGVVTKALSGIDYVVPSTLAATLTTYATLSYTNNTFVPGPSAGSAFQVLTWSALTNTWVASSIPSTGIITNNVDNAPIGSVSYFAATTPPVGYLECNGAAISVIQYQELTSAIYCGDANNATALFGYRCTNSSSPNTSRSITGQFIVLPDLRGEFIRGWDRNRGIDVGRAFGTSQADELRSHTHPLDKALTWPTRTGIPAVTEQNQGGNPEDYCGYLPSTESTGGLETRPRNIALLPCIKATKTITGSVEDLNFIPKPVVGLPYQVITYDPSTNSWEASAVPNIAPLQVDNTPIGSINYFAAGIAPTGYLECNGAAVSRSQYSDLFAVIGVRYGSGNGSSTFNLPDLRGEFVRGWDNGRGVDNNRALGSNQSHSLQNHGHDLNTSATYSTRDDLRNADIEYLAGDSLTHSEAMHGGTGSLNAEKYISNIRADAGVNIGTETRPRNVALMACIKAVNSSTSATVQSLNFIPKPPGAGPDSVLVYNNSTTTWEASSLSVLLGTASVAEPAIGLPLKNWGHYNGSFYTKNQIYYWGVSWAVSNNGDNHNPPVRATFLNNYLLKNPGVTIKKVYDGYYNHFALLSDGTFWGNGNSPKWQNVYDLADNYTAMYLPLNSMLLNKAVTDFSVSSDNSNNVTVGVLCTDGTSYVWGYNGHGQLGRGNTTNANSPVLVTIPNRTVAQISVAGWGGTNGNILVRTTNGELYACGYNAHGQLGVGDTTERKTFTRCVASGSPITNVANICEVPTMQGGYTRYVIKTDGTLWATGLNDVGQLGIPAIAVGTNSNNYRQVTLPNGTVITKVVTAGWSTATTVAALDSTGNVYTWGYSGHGQTGTGTNTSYTAPTRVTVYQSTPNQTASLPPIRDIFGTSNSEVGAIGLISTGKQLFTAGYQIWPAITRMKTTGDSTSNYYRFELVNLENVVTAGFYTDQLSNGGGHSVGTIAIDDKGVVWCWGYNGGYITPNNQVYRNPTRINY